MPQVGIVRENAILPFPAGMDLTGQEGRPVNVDVNEPDYPVNLSQDTGVIPIGLLIKGGKAGETVSVAIASGGLAGTVRVKLSANVASPGDYLKLGFLADGYCAFAPGTTSGERVIMAQALETGLAGEKIEAVLFKPEYFGS